MVSQTPQKPEAGRSHSGQSLPRRAGSHRGAGQLGTFARRLGLTLSGAALLLAGIAMGNHVRKRLDRMAHGF